MSAGQSPAPPRLTLYLRVGCHLCEDMLRHLVSLRAELGFELQQRDVDAEAGLAARFGHLVPVLMAGERELCHYYLDEAGLRQYLLSVRQQAAAPQG